MSSVMKSSSTKAGSRTTSAFFIMDAGKRCGTIAEAVEASRSPAAGLLAFLPKYQALVAILNTRKGSEDVFDKIAPLTAAAELAKTMIRGRRGLVVTRAMEEALQEIIIWHAKRCGASLRTGDASYKPTKNKAKNKQRYNTVIRILTKERRLIAKMQAGIMIPRSASSSTVDSTISTASTSTASSGSSESVLSRRYAMLCSFSKAMRVVV